MTQKTDRKNTAPQSRPLKEGGFSQPLEKRLFSHLSVLPEFASTLGFRSEKIPVTGSKDIPRFFIKEEGKA